MEQLRKREVIFIQFNGNTEKVENEDKKQGNGILDYRIPVIVRSMTNMRYLLTIMRERPSRKSS